MGINLKATGAEAKKKLSQASKATSNLFNKKNTSESRLPCTRSKTVLSTSEQAKAQEIFELLDVKNSELIISYGNKTQEDVAKFADIILAEVQTSDLDDIGAKVSDMIVAAKSLDVTGLNKTSWMKKIPFIGDRLFNKIQHLKSEFNSIAENIENTSLQLNITKNKLIERCMMLDTLYEKNVIQYKELNIYIVAAEMKVQEWVNEIKPDMQKDYENSQDPLMAQDINDGQQAISRLEKKIHNLKLTSQATLQTSPQIRMIQSNNEMLAERIQNTTDLTIPLWKKQFLMAISLDEQKKGAALNELVTDATNEFMKAGADLLQDNSINIAQQNERGVIDIETIEHVQQSLIATLEGVANIQAEGAQKREAESLRLEELKFGVMARLT